MVLIMLITVFLCLLSTINAFPDGTPVGDCETNHTTDPQNSTAPYTISVESMYYSNGSTVKGNLTGSTTQFIGYLLRMIQTDNNKTIAGFSIEKETDGQLFACDGQNNTAVTQKDNMNKSSVSFTWTAPAETVGPLQVVATVVKDNETFWTMLKSKDIIPHGGQETTTPDGGQTTTTPDGGQGTTTSNSAVFTVSSFLGILGAVVMTVLML